MSTPINLILKPRQPDTDNTPEVADTHQNQLDQINGENTFKEWNLHPTLEKALTSLQFKTPTPIQAKAIPIALSGKDIIGCAQTGTGKTAAFCIPILMKMLEAKPEQGLSRALVLVPTRELAQQIDQFWKQLTQFNHKYQSAVLIGGASMVPQIKALRAHPRVIIATPGRLLDHLDRRTVQLEQVKFLVLDEADRMLDMGFEPQLEAILRLVPKERQTLFFSATMPPEAEKLASRYLKSPEKVSTGVANRAATLVKQRAMLLTHDQKNDQLLNELNGREGSKLIFARTQIRTDRVARYLNSYGLSVSCIHGGRTQAQRNSALLSFKNGRTQILVATEVAARGLDIDHVAHVINYDLPQVPEDYIHRIGRTARAGRSGEAMSFIAREERGLWKDIVRCLKKSGSTIPNEEQCAAIPNQHGFEKKNQAASPVAPKSIQGILSGAKTKEAPVKNSPKNPDILTLNSIAPEFAPEEKKTYSEPKKKFSKDRGGDNRGGRRDSRSDTRPENRREDRRDSQTSARPFEKNAESGFFIKPKKEGSFDQGRTRSRDQKSFSSPYGSKSKNATDGIDVRLPREGLRLKMRDQKPKHFR